MAMASVAGGIMVVEDDVEIVDEDRVDWLTTSI